MGFSAKVHLQTTNRNGESVALQFTPDYRDGRNADWAHATPGLNLAMTMRSDVFDRLGLAAGQDFTLTFERDGAEQGVLAPPAATEEEPADVEVLDAQTGGTKHVTASEARDLGYVTSGGAAEGQAAPVGIAPLPTPVTEAPSPAEDSA